MALLLPGVEAAFLLWSLALAVPILVLALQVAAAPRRGRKPAQPAAGRPALAVLIPAHNEAGRIGASLAALRSQLQRGDRLLVVADNCSDDTAVLAHLGGAEVAIRSGPLLRGKGQALAFGIGQLAAAPPKVVIVVDAGCLLEAGAVDALARSCAAYARPMQAACSVRAASANRGAEFALAVKQQLRPRGGERLGFGCQLTVGAVALPWTLARAAPLTGPAIAEGPRLGPELALASAAPRFCPQATATVTAPSQVADGGMLRTRWEREHLALIGHYGARMVARSVARRDPQLLALALDLCVPPASLLLTLAALCGACGALGWALSGRMLPWAPAMLLPALLALALMLAWHKAGRASRPGHALLYALAEVPFYLRLARRGRTAPVIAARDEPRART